MVNALLCSSAMAIARADDFISMLQVSSVQRSKGQRILDAMAEDGQDTICVHVTAGDVAPVRGSFSAQKSQQAVEVPAGSIAGEGGSFCVPKQNVLLLQRTLGLATARDLDAVLGKKKGDQPNAKETVNKDNFATWDFVGDYHKKDGLDANKQCQSTPTPTPTSLLQTMDATVTQKKKNTPDEDRMCECRRHLKEAGYFRGSFLDYCGRMYGKTDQELHAKDRWASVAKSLNQLSSSGPRRESGSEHCDKSWVVEAACHGVTVPPR